MLHAGFIKLCAIVYITGNNNRVRKTVLRVPVKTVRLRTTIVKFFPKTENNGGRYDTCATVTRRNRGVMLFRCSFYLEEHRVYDSGAADVIT